MSGLADPQGTAIALDDHGAPSQRAAFSFGESDDCGQSARSLASPAPFASVVVYESLAAVAPVWLHLQASAPASPYQTLAWTEAWMRTEGLASRTLPVIGVALDAEGRPLALLPFGRRRRGWLTIAGFLGGRHANYNFGLFDPSVVWSVSHIARLLRAIAEASPGIDVFALTNQPFTWGAWNNPLAQLPRQASPSQAHSAVLPADGDAYLREHLSANARKKLRSKLGHLKAIGDVGHVVARSDEMVASILDALTAQKAAKLASVGALTPADLVATRCVLEEVAQTGSAERSPLELHALFCGPRIVATFGGLSHAGRFAGLAISHDDDPVYARHSPGELLLCEVIKGKCAEGYSSFDLGIGDDRYKQSLCPIVDPLFDSLVPVSAKGRLFVAHESLRLRVKGRIKNSRWAWPLVKRLRKGLAAALPPR